MSNASAKLTHGHLTAAKARRLEAMQLQEIEGNPLDGEQIALFEMFERKRWSHERRRQHLLERAKGAVPALHAAE